MTRQGLAVTSIKTFIIAVCALGVAGSSGCRFKSPTIAEQDYLVQKGAFPRGAPGWVAHQYANAGSTPSRGSGLIPQAFPASRIGRANLAQRAEAVAGDESETLHGLGSVADREKQAEAAAPEVIDSPLARIEHACPGSEPRVIEALRTTELDARIKQYERLVARCSSSHDLWMWLGKDYRKKKTPVLAARAFEKVLTLDAGNAEAKELLAESRSQNAPAPAVEGTPSLEPAE